jgi:hypothetical protein
VRLSLLLQVAASLYESVHDDASFFFKSFFSSVVGGITTEPALMVIPMDDHLVHRGHGVFDTAIMARGNLYQLEDHLDRLLKSASAAGIALPTSREQLRRIILDTAAASQCRDGAPLSHVGGRTWHCYLLISTPVGPVPVSVLRACYLELNLQHVQDCMCAV